MVWRCPGHLWVLILFTRHSTIWYFFLPRVWCHLDYIWPWSESLISTLYYCSSVFWSHFDQKVTERVTHVMILTMSSPFDHLMDSRTWTIRECRTVRVCEYLIGALLSVLNPHEVGSLRKLNIQPKYSCAINNLNQSSNWCSQFTGKSSCDLNHQETCSSTEVEYCHRNDIITCSLHFRWFKIQHCREK